MKKNTKELYEYKLTSTNADEGYTSSRKYYFRKETAKEHNKQYTLNDVPRKLVKIRNGKPIEVPAWWSGNITKFIK